MRAILAVFALALSSVVAFAQESGTLADIRQELTVLHVEVQKLKRELSTTGSAGSATGGGSVLDRVNSIEEEVQRLTAKTEQLEFRIEQVVTDGTRRIGDLEFRLVELEGGDVSQLGETTTLGGQVLGEDLTDVMAPEVTDREEDDAPQLAEAEVADFEAARKALEEGDFASAADKLSAFNEIYPGSPLGQQAQLTYGAALEGQGDIRSAARAYLDAFRLDPNGEHAPEALFRLGKGLGQLGQTAEACTTLAEVGVRFPVGEPADKAEAERARLECS